MKYSTNFFDLGLIFSGQLWSYKKSCYFVGLNSMKSFRGVRRKDGGSKLKDSELCNGPSKLCQALCIEKANLNKEDITSSNRFWLEDDKDYHEEDITIVTSTRIGIASYGSEWALKPLRFYILGNKCVSVKDKKVEAELV